MILGNPHPSLRVRAYHSQHEAVELLTASLQELPWEPA
jgi:hypothetical protein